MRRAVVVTLLCGWILLLAPASTASLLSKTYEFKSGVILAVGAATDDGVRLDTVRFRMPAPVDGKVVRSGGQVRVEVAISNTSRQARRIGVAVALFDEQGRLVGVASGGSQLVALKPERQKTFHLVFDDVNAGAGSTRTFQVSVETR